MPDVNWLAVLAATVPSFFFGGLWYSKAMFCNVWAREAKIDMAAAETRHPAKVFGISLALAFVATTLLAVLLGPHPSVASGVKWGAAIGAGIAGTSFGINYAFVGHSVKLWAIDAGYHTIQFALAGLILGLFA